MPNLALLPATPLISALVGSVAAAAVVALSIGSQVLKQRFLLRSFLRAGLRPNILLTRHPLVFVNRKRRLFRLFGDFNIVPFALREHGFDVTEIELANADAFSTNLTVDDVDFALSRLDRPVHVFLHPSIQPKAFRNGKVVSVTPLSDPSLDQALQRAVSLAELDVE